MPIQNKTHKQRKGKLIPFLWITFGLSILVFIADIVYVIGIKQVLFNTAPIIFVIILSIDIFVGGLSFFLAVILTLLRKNLKGQKVTFSKIVRACLTLAILPIYLLITGLSDKSRGWLARMARGIIPLILLIPFWILGYVVLYYVSTDELLLGTRYQVSSIAYSESMIPTIKPGSLGKYHPYKNIIYKINPSWAHKIRRGDIISFRNNATISYLSEAKKDSGNNYIKRVVAIKGDTIEMRAGVIVLNEIPLSEPYTLKPNSTFALDEAYKAARLSHLPGLFLEECKPITVPTNKLFVLGDNRQNSNDSRIIDFVDLNDIRGYFPYQEQKTPFKHGVNTINYSDEWRTSNDLTPAILEEVYNYCK